MWAGRGSRPVSTRSRLVTSVEAHPAPNTIKKRLATTIARFPENAHELIPFFIFFILCVACFTRADICEKITPPSKGGPPNPTMIEREMVLDFGPMEKNRRLRNGCRHLKFRNTQELLRGEKGSKTAFPEMGRGSEGPGRSLIGPFINLDKVITQGVFYCT